MASFTTAALRLLEYLSKARRAEIGLNHLPIICGPRTVKELEGRGYIKVSIELTDRGRRELKERAAREAREKASGGKFGNIVDRFNDELLAGLHESQPGMRSLLCGDLGEAGGNGGPMAGAPTAHQDLGPVSEMGA